MSASTWDTSPPLHLPGGPVPRRSGEYRVGAFVVLVNQVGVSRPGRTYVLPLEQILSDCGSPDMGVSARRVSSTLVELSDLTIENFACLLK